MKKSELKRILKPLVRECIREELASSGLLSNVVAEVAKGLQGAMIVEAKATPVQITSPAITRTQPTDTERERALQEHRSKLLESIGRDSFNGVDIFENVNPAPPEPSSVSSASSPLSGQDPNDAGIDISNIVALGGKAWSQLIK